MVHRFDSISITQFPAMICLVFSRRLPKSCYSLNLDLSPFDLNHFGLICVHLLLV